MNVLPTIGIGIRKQSVKLIDQGDDRMQANSEMDVKGHIDGAFVGKYNIWRCPDSFGGGDSIVNAIESTSFNLLSFAQSMPWMDLFIRNAEQDFHLVEMSENIGEKSLSRKCHRFADHNKAGCNWIEQWYLAVPELAVMFNLYICRRCHIVNIDHGWDCCLSDWLVNLD